MSDDYDDPDFQLAMHWANGAPALSAYPENGPFVYYIQCGSFLKIGHSIDPETRCEQLRRGGKAQRPSLWVGNPQLIAYLPGNVRRERELHQQFAHLRDQGEWFELDHDLAEHVSDMRDQQALQEVADHHERHLSKVISHGWPEPEVSIAQRFREQLSKRPSLDLEWIEAFA